MNNQNSVLIEGKLEADPASFESDGKPAWSFEVISVQHDRPFRFLVVVEARLAEVCTDYLKKGRGVRVVGSLKEEDGKVWIAAEHVEFRPAKENSDE